MLGDITLLRKHLRRYLLSTRSKGRRSMAVTGPAAFGDSWGNWPRCALAGTPSLPTQGLSDEQRKNLLTHLFSICFKIQKSRQCLQSSPPPNDGNSLHPLPELWEAYTTDVFLNQIKHQGSTRRTLIFELCTCCKLLQDNWGDGACLFHKQWNVKSIYHLASG